MDIRPVSSKEFMLKPEDIFVVCSHYNKPNIKGFKAAAKKAGMTEERMAYSLYLNAYSDARLLRVRAGNTLFTIAALPNRVGFVRMYNADTGQNLINNIVEFFDSARAMGFDVLVAQPNQIAKKAIMLAARQNDRPGVETKFADNFLVVVTGEKRK